MRFFGSLLNLVVPLRVVLHLDKDAFDFYALITFNFAGLSQVGTRAVTIAHYHGLQANEGIFKLLLNRYILHLVAKLVR